VKFWHIGMLTEDIDKTLETFFAFPGTRREAWTRGEMEFAASEMLMGTGGRLKTAMGRLGGIAYELIQPLDEHSYHASALRERGPCIHHAAYICEEDQDEVVSSLLAAGGRMVWEARHGAEHVCYVEAAEGRTVWEIINRCPFMPGE